MDDFILGVASFLLVLIPLVILHEFGHFIAAKLVGITVLEFGIGFPPRAAVLFRRGDTIYTLNWLPIGGFVRPYGEDFVRPKTEDEMSFDQQEIIDRGIKNPKSVFQAGPWERMFFMAAGPGVNFVLTLVLFIAVALVGQPYPRADVTVYDVISGSPAAEAGLEQGDVLVQLNGEKLDSADEFNDRIQEYSGQPVTLLVERDGQQSEITLLADTFEQNAVERVYITSVQENGPAERAGFLPEDLITAVDGIEITSPDQIIDYTKAHEDIEMDVTVRRGTETLHLKVTPEMDSDGTVRIGIHITGVKPAIIGLIAVNTNTKTITKALPPGQAIQVGFDSFTETLSALGDFVQDLVRGDIAPEAARPVSPVGIGQIGGVILDQSLEEGQMHRIVWFAALISISLAITNLLPIPGLDGGRILFVVIELIRGKPMEPEREGAVHFIGVLLLLGLIVFTFFYDIIDPIDVSGLK